ncbi:serine/arginine repetitive matrix protein 1 [Nerophis ophidion]|uniref:serine/arginine repetitive matrix protein 1 n=1 Tax=Nerophis ophidion TaxID=159077 RepID=UPI002AE04D00|nr:serine/arginine repetitive matrix protein 1 [Nerophis ophidion]XP_061772496.1 serine/arginine repetitive matrix protein 1 [Nerophis ophidion]XP_061772506.1 serine/arginine repetitive matrix protein 1 [Nerophis ophidion]XP_061772514.1 serine/arginine repetitive matrix protein 1 [Nerophis ophidion]XP_061772522.1 serine/arginine repetitive matrix protein 1 [Nerophis ophidion]XP_061772532.1 serine/arginine repetitive matrix protein 1 [Nerophis ophidion]XP_061772540.1 serine/arginine repetitive
MAETERSLCEYREKHGGERDGEGLKATPPLRGRGCGRKRKGTPVKVFVTAAEEENNPELTFCRGDRKEAAEGKRATPDGPLSATQPSPGNCTTPEKGQDKFPSTSKASSSSSASTPATSSARTPTPVPAPATNPATSAQGAPSVTPAFTAPAAPVASATAPASSSFPPSPNCRIREVHCGSQVRLVVIAIRDITKGEEITVDYSLTEWGENLGFRGSMSAAQQECNSESNNSRKEEEPVSLTPQRHQRQKPRAHQDFVTPSWSLSPSSSPISHSDASESDAADEDNASPRGRTPRRRRRRRGTPSKKKTPNRTPPASSSHPLPSSQPPSSPPSSASTKPVFKAPALLDSGSVSTNGQKGGVSIDAMRQSCDYCGRHFRSLGRHLDKHHSHQPDVCSALVERYTQMHNASPAPAHTQQHPAASEADPMERSGVQDLSLSPPPAATAKQSSCASPSLTPPPGQSAVPVSVLKRSPPPVAATPSKKGGAKRLKRERQEGEEDEEVVEVVEVKRSKEEDEECAQSFRSKGKEEEEEEEEVDDESGTEEKDKDSLSSGRHQMLPLLSSLSSLVLYLRRLQHSAFLSLSRQLQSAEAWRLLCHSSLALLILYNRRRECEVSKLSITEYRARVTPQCPVPVPPGSPPALTPLEASLSPFERLVLPHLPRVGVQGKRGRIQPLILPPHCEPCLELLLQTRQDVGVDPANQYVFARPYHSPATPLRGTDLLRSLARSSGTRNPRALTQTRVRRQVAILTQLLLLGEGEEPGQPEGSAVERLEHFLEREYHVTQNCADIGQDPGLMGSVGRVVLCGERDGVLFRGMSLNHICLELDVMSGNSADSYSEGESEGEQKEKPEPPALSPSPKPAPTLLYVRKGKNNGRVGRPKKLKNSQAPPHCATPTPPPLPVNRRRGSGKRGVLKRPWSEAERAAVEEHLTRNINELRVPAKADCERCLQQCPLLVSNQRDWRAIKFYCHNRIQLLKKNQRRESELQPLAVC